MGLHLAIVDRLMDLYGEPLPTRFLQLGDTKKGFHLKFNHTCLPNEGIDEDSFEVFFDGQRVATGDSYTDSWMLPKGEKEEVDQMREFADWLPGARPTSAGIL